LHSLDIHGFDSLDTYEYDKKGTKLSPKKYHCYTWIKADPTFNGLKQIFYEPIERVEISKSKPEDKSGYRVIESVTIEHNDFQNEILYFNENLNSIIGGRSSGKSLLLGAIAKKLDTETLVKENIDYEKYVVSVSENLTINWKDGQIDNNREIEYFPQNHMYSLANEGNKIDNLIDSIIRQDESKNNILNDYNSFCNNKFTEIANKIIKIFQIIENIKKSKFELKLRGDEEGIKLEINKLNEELKILKSESALTESEIDQFNKLKTKRDILISEVKFHDIEISKISSLRLKLFFSDIEFELANLSKETREILLDEYKNILKEYQEKWEQSTNKLLEKIQGLKKEKISEISKIENDIVYQKGVTALRNNSFFLRLQKNLEHQNEKLSEIKNIKNEIEELKFQFDELKRNTLKLHKQYFDEIEIIKDSLSEKRNKLKINATSKINFESFFQLINRSINQQISKNQKYLSPEINNEEKYFEILETLFDEVLSENIILKGGYKLQQLCYELMTTNFFEIAYDIEYENDNFIQMSEGKKSFVVMMLLLDFSKKDCPILIDQPEDDLDNRAIYNDLVKYLKEKKKERQILLVTHNPNIVVGADSELVIVANQHGKDTPNDKNTKFQYISGSLENSHLNNIEGKIILESQGIKEHVCEILEGGNAAFKKRELKYNIK
jgi:predicted ATPase